MAKEKKGGKDGLVVEMRERFDRCLESDSDLRSQALEDVKFVFVPGNQWDEALKKKRKKRPCYEFNRLRQSVKQVVNEIRKNKPAIKVRAVDSGADKDTAETLNGLIRNIESVSNADTAYATAALMAGSGGFGAWRVTTDYADDSAFDQDIFIREIRNPFSVYFDPAAQEWDRRDGLFCFVTNLISRDEFETRWPEAEVVDFDASAVPDWHRQWYLEDKVRIAEYWCKKPATKTICLMSTGETVDKAEIEPVLDDLAASGRTVVREREVKCYKIYQYLMSGAGELEPPTEWAGKYIPIVPVWGELINVEGRDVYSGMVRHSKDPARAYNFHRTAMIEQAANMPLAPYMVTPQHIKGYETIWGESSAENFPYLPFNPDPNMPGGLPQRIQPPTPNIATLEIARLDAEDIKATTGIHDASLGARSNETSGRAILARKEEGDTANFDITDNLARAIKFTGDIIVDLCPKIYDTQRVIRILGEDGAEKSVQLYEEVVDQQTGQVVKLNDLSRGKYDVAVTVGPSYATARMEAADQLLAIAQGNKDPAIGLLLTRFIVKNLDMPGATELEKPIKKMLIAQGLIEPEPDEQVAPPQPNPMQQMEAATAAAKAEQEAHRAAKEKFAVDGQQLTNQKLELQIAALAQQISRPPESEGPGRERVEFAKIESENRRHREKLEFDRATALELEHIKQAGAAAQAAQQPKPQERAARDPGAGRTTDAALTAAIGSLAQIMQEMHKPRRIVRSPDGRAVGTERVDKLE